MLQVGQQRQRQRRHEPAPQAPAAGAPQLPLGAAQAEAYLRDLLAQQRGDARLSQPYRCMSDELSVHPGFTVQEVQLLQLM